ncbi:MAG: hypothetical protein HYZ49_01480 [Chloroflexi bacterium]|nr:hypothetical protein [Chloroflexota bacterium]
MIPQARAVLDEPKPPVGIIESLTTGFEAVASHLSLLLLPIILDLFLWLGPHLSVNPIAQRSIDFLRSIEFTDPASLQGRQIWVDILQELGRRTNIFTLLSTAPLGVPSLMTSQLPILLPGGQPVLWLVDNELFFLTLALAFSITGLLLGAIYFSTIGSLLQDGDRPTLIQTLRRVLINWARLAAFCVVVGFSMVFISLPVLVFIGILQIISPALAGLGISVWGALMLWLFLYLAFSMHGMVLKDRGVFGSILDSVRLVQWNIWPVMGLFAVIAVLNWGLGYVWSLPAPDSWLTLAGIGGHAFVSTGLVAATFVFYKDRYRWWTEMRQWLVVNAKLKR